MPQMVRWSASHRGHVWRRFACLRVYVQPWLICAVIYYSYIGSHTRQRASALLIPGSTTAINAAHVHSCQPPAASTAGEKEGNSVFYAGFFSHILGLIFSNNHYMMTAAEFISHDRHCVCDSCHSKCAHQFSRRHLRLNIPPHQQVLCWNTQNNIKHDLVQYMIVKDVNKLHKDVNKLHMKQRAGADFAREAPCCQFRHHDMHDGKLARAFLCLVTGCRCLMSCDRCVCMYTLKHRYVCIYIHRHIDMKV